MAAAHLLPPMNLAEGEPPRVPHASSGIEGVAFGFRLELEDFRVEELDLYPLSGEGEHLVLRVEKRGIDTPRAARELARALGLQPRDVGHAGLKDARGVTTQRLSLWAPARPDLTPERVLGLELPGLRVLEAARHGNKLRPGHLAGNRFELLLRDVEPGGLERVGEVLDVLQRRGMPNRFGPQRFGRAGRNADCGRAWMAGDLAGYLRASGVRSLRSVSRGVRGLHLAAWQARVFQRVLAARLVDGPDWTRLRVGDLAQRVDSGGLFEVQDPELEQHRVEALELAATGPLPGPRARRAGGSVGEAEDAALDAEGLGPEPYASPLGPLGRMGARRPLWVPLRGVELEARGPHLRLAFALPPGSYATALVEELGKGRAFGPDAGQSDASGAPTGSD